MIAYFFRDRLLGVYEGETPELPSFHFLCPSCGEIWARIIVEPGRYHRPYDSTRCDHCRRNTQYGLWDGCVQIPFFPEYDNFAPLAVLTHNFLQLYSTRVSIQNDSTPPEDPTAV